MSAVNPGFDLQGQICYVQCGYCTTILLVSVPQSSLSMVVTVKCGHCTSLLSVNMVKASFAPLHLFPSLIQSDQDPEHEMKNESLPEIAKDSQKDMDKHSSSPVISSDEEDDYDLPSNLIINRPPEKRQRAPSAYNRFIKEEIRRLKAKNPNMAHKQAFSTAAKNWAQFPPSLSKLGDEEAAASKRARFQARSM
ncbi:Axial regulator YABBY 4 [Heracleum sosnowskyi]|uniref:Axial regulator YABBY 4 n=1 Tax=Heracleum sosnowskyi TaxID=360622 RepID=A0AAD8I131_9APIA|nr:Axial regulator YABBY 4 [Heracleum sosnowskyi]